MCPTDYYLCGACSYTFNVKISQCPTAVEYGKHRPEEAYTRYQGVMGYAGCQPTFEKVFLPPSQTSSHPCTGLSSLFGHWKWGELMEVGRWKLDSRGSRDPRTYKRWASLCCPKNCPWPTIWYSKRGIAVEPLLPFTEIPQVPSYSAKSLSFIWSW